MNPYYPDDFPHHVAPGQNQSWAQWRTRLSDYLPDNFVSLRLGSMENCYENGATVQEAARFAQAFLGAPVIEPPGWENVFAVWGWENLDNVGNTGNSHNCHFTDDCEEWHDLEPGEDESA